MNIVQKIGIAIALSSIGYGLIQWAANPHLTEMQAMVAFWHAWTIGAVGAAIAAFAVRRG